MRWQVHNKTMKKKRKKWNLVSSFINSSSHLVITVCCSPFCSGFLLSAVPSKRRPRRPQILLSPLSSSQFSLSLSGAAVCQSCLSLTLSFNIFVCRRFLLLLRLLVGSVRFLCQLSHFSPPQASLTLSLTHFTD